MKLYKGNAIAAEVSVEEEGAISLSVLRGHVRVVVTDQAALGPCRGERHPTRKRPAERCDRTVDRLRGLRTRSGGVLLPEDVARRGRRTRVPARPDGSSFRVAGMA